MHVYFLLKGLFVYDIYYSRHMEEGRSRKGTHYDQDDEDLQMRNDFRKPRDSLLNVIAEFYSTCQPRLRELRKILADPSFRPPELLDHKSHNVSITIYN